MTEALVYFGTMDIPAGTYTDGVIHISKVVVDTEEDLSATRNTQARH